MHQIDVNRRAAKRKQTALSILAKLDLIRRWQRFGRPVVVGALSYDLLVAPDIDMEVYCPNLRVADGFEVLNECAQQPGVVKAQFTNFLEGPDKALYWQLRYREEDGTVWKIDMWSASEDYDLPRSEHMVEPMRASLTPETRLAILDLKEQREQDPDFECLSIDLYRAVLQDGVRTFDELRAWVSCHETGQLTAWRPIPQSGT
jgi:hypothetical protein